LSSAPHDCAAKRCCAIFVGIAVPVLLAYVLGSDVIEPLKRYRSLAVGLLGLTAVIQALLVIWSLLARWDEELAYDTNAARESYLLKEAWLKLGRGDSEILAVEYNLLRHQQSLADARDAGKGITESEKQFGMRNGLIENQRKCVCGVIPTQRRVPWRPKTKCAVCGGNEGGRP
jgi:mobilome CxxCx(11)CxxC protein